MHSPVKLILLASLLVAGLQWAEATQSYVIKARQISDAPEALAHLRRFIPDSMSLAERCERYGVLLKALKAGPQDQFRVANLGLCKRDVVSPKFKAIDAETLRQLYIEGIDQYRASKIEEPMLDLVDCLEDKFRSVDTLARSYLNQQELRDLIAQYKSIASLPLEFLIDPHARHPFLRASQLKPAVRRLVTDLLGGYSEEVELRFPDAPRRSAVATAVASVDTAARVEPLEQPSSTKPSQAESVSATTQHATVQATSEPAPAVAVPMPTEDDLLPEEKEFVDDLTGSLLHVYSTIPLEATLGDRCAAYGTLIESEGSSLSLDFADKVAQQAAEKLRRVGPSDAPYRPSKMVKDNFLLALNLLRPESIGAAVMIDLVDCISQWEKEDPEVHAFMNDPMRQKLFLDLLKQAEAEDAE